MNNYYDDWSDSFDDAGSSYWESYLGGPDDGFFESLNQSDRHNDSNQEYDEYGRLLSIRRRDDDDDDAYYHENKDEENEIDDNELFLSIINTYISAQPYLYSKPSSCNPKYFHVNELFEKAKKNILPEDFTDWGLNNLYGWSVAHVAAAYGSLSDNFNDWNLTLESGGGTGRSRNPTVAHIAAIYNNLPNNFNLWELADDYGITVGHIAAYFNRLPDGFSNWNQKGEFSSIKPTILDVLKKTKEKSYSEFILSEQRVHHYLNLVTNTILSDFKLWHACHSDYWSIAHQAAKFNTLPDGFNDWGIQCYDWSVAHEAAKSRIFSSDFVFFRLCTASGWTVAHEAARYGNLPCDFNQWSIADEEGWTVAHEAARYGNLPCDFNQWDIADEEGWTVAHEAARRNNLPKNFTLWNLKSNYVKSNFK